MPSAVHVKNKPGMPLVRLSPNEEARLLKEERERRKKIRLLQVREQAKANAARIRQNVKVEKDKQIQLLARQLKEEWELDKASRLQKLKELYERSLKSVGEGHQGAQLIEQEAAHERKVELMKEDFRRAEERHKTALKKLRREQEEKELEANRHVMNRQIALEMERSRAAKIAALPLPAPDPIMAVEIPKVKPVKLTDTNAFSTTHYHLREDYAVEKATPEEQLDAKASATEEEERVQEILNEKKRVVHERREKARLRHKHALGKELLKQEYEQILHDLSDLQRADIHRRQQVIAKIPRQVFQAPHRRLEEKQEEQFGMERAFEDLYMAATDNQGNLSLALDPHPAPGTPEHTDSLDLSVTASEGVATPVKPQPRKEKSHVSGDQTSQTSQPAPTSPAGVQPPGVASGSHQNSGVFAKRPKLPETSLRRLYDRIKSQRDNWASRSSREISELDQMQEDTPATDKEDRAHTLPIPQVTQFPGQHTQAISQDSQYPSQKTQPITQNIQFPGHRTQQYTQPIPQDAWFPSQRAQPLLQDTQFPGQQLRAPQIPATSQSQVTFPGSQRPAGTPYSSVTSTEPSPSQYTLSSSEVSSEVSSRLTATRVTTGRLTMTDGSSEVEEGPITPSQGSTITSVGSEVSQPRVTTRGHVGSGLLGPSGSATLLHPMEEAARIRQQPAMPGSELSAFLAQERDKQEQLQKQSDRVCQQTELDRRALETQRVELQKKIEEIESQRRRLEAQVVEVLSADSQLSSPRDDRVPGPSHPNLPPLINQNMSVQLPGSALSKPSMSVNKAQHSGLSAGFIDQTRHTLPERQSNGQPLGSYEPLHLGNIIAPGVVVGAPGSGVENHQVIRECTPDQPGSPSSIDLRNGQHEEVNGNHIIISELPSVVGKNVDSDHASSRSSYSTVQGKEPVEILKVRAYQQQLLERYKEKQKKLEESRSELNQKADVLMKRYIPEYYPLEPDDSANRNINSEREHFVEAGSPHLSTDRIVDIGKEMLNEHADTLIKRYLPEHLNQEQSEETSMRGESLLDENTPIERGREHGMGKEDEGQVFVRPSITGHVSFHEAEAVSPESLDSKEDEVSDDQGTYGIVQTDSKLVELEAETARQREKFEKQQMELRRQLLEIQKQKQDILERQEQQQNESRSLRRQWAEELEKYHVKNQVEESPSEPENPPLVSNAAGADQDSQERDKSNAVPGQRSRLHAQIKPPTKQFHSVMHAPHELSAIEEMDTPVSFRMSSSGGETEARKNRSPYFVDIAEEERANYDGQTGLEFAVNSRLSEAPTMSPGNVYHVPNSATIDPHGQQQLTDSGFLTQPQTIGDLHVALGQAKDELERARQLKNSLGRALEDMKQRTFEEELPEDSEPGLDFVQSPIRPQVVGHEQDENDEPGEEFHPSFEGITVGLTPKRPSVPGEPSTAAYSKDSSTASALAGISEGSLFTESSYYSPPDNYRMAGNYVNETGQTLLSSALSDVRTPRDIHLAPNVPDDIYQERPNDARTPDNLGGPVFSGGNGPKQTVLRTSDEQADQLFSPLHAESESQLQLQYCPRESNSEMATWHEELIRLSGRPPVSQTPQVEETVDNTKHQVRYFRDPPIGGGDLSERVPSHYSDSSLTEVARHSNSQLANFPQDVSCIDHGPGSHDVVVMPPHHLSSTPARYFGKEIPDEFVALKPDSFAESGRSNEMSSQFLSSRVDMHTGQNPENNRSQGSDPKRLSTMSRASETSQYPIQEESTLEYVTELESKMLISPDGQQRSGGGQASQEMSSIGKSPISYPSEISQTLSESRTRTSYGQKGTSSKSFGSGISKVTLNSQTSAWTEEPPSEISRPRYPESQPVEASSDSNNISQHPIEGDDELSWQFHQSGASTSSNQYSQHALTSEDDSVFLQFGSRSKSGNVPSVSGHRSDVTESDTYAIAQGNEFHAAKQRPSTVSISQFPLESIDEAAFEQSQTESSQYPLDNIDETKFVASGPQHSNKASLSQYPLDSSDETGHFRNTGHFHSNKTSVSRYPLEGNDSTLYRDTRQMQLKKTSLSQYPLESSDETLFKESGRHLHSSKTSLSQYPLESSDDNVFLNSRQHVQPKLSSVSQYPLQDSFQASVTMVTDSRPGIMSGQHPLEQTTGEDVTQSRQSFGASQASFNQYPLEDTTVNISVMTGGVPKSDQVSVSQYPLDDSGKILHRQDEYSLRGDPSQMAEASQHPLAHEEDSVLRHSQSGAETSGVSRLGPMFNLQARKVPDDILSQKLRSYMEELSQHPIGNDTSVWSKTAVPGYSKADSSSVQFSPAQNRNLSSTGATQFVALEADSWSSPSYARGPVTPEATFHGQQFKHLTNEQGSSLHRNTIVTHTKADEVPSVAQDETFEEQLQRAAFNIDTRIQDSLRKYEDLLEERQRMDVHGSNEALERQMASSSDSHLSLSMLAEEHTGISEEPELSLVSVGSERQSPGRSAYDASCEEQHSRSLASFEQHEQSLTSAECSLVHVTPDRRSPSKQSGGNSSTGRLRARQSEGVRFSPIEEQQSSAENEDRGKEMLYIPVQHVDDTDSADSFAGLSLQEALEKKRHDFIHASQQRQQDAKFKAKTKSQKTTGHAPLTKTLVSWKKSRGLKKTSKPGSSAESAESDQEVITKTSTDRKGSEREMKERTTRLYKQLEEVKQRKVETDRKKEYAKNREKAKEYHRKHQEQLKKKSGPKQ